MLDRRSMLAAVALLWGGMPCASYAEEKSMPAWWPMSGLDLIPDSKTALTVAKTILDRYYGEEMVRRYEPYAATLSGDEWWIFGTNPDLPRDLPQGTIVFGGGFPEISLARHDGRVLRIALAR
jgi:hypothetical protein